jgi:hypothetical protein
MEFNLEGTLWFSLTLVVSNMFSTSYYRSAFLLSANVLLIILGARAIFLAMFVYTFWSSILRVRTIVLLAAIGVFFMADIINSLMQIDRWQYYLAYVNYIFDNSTASLMPNLSQSVDGLAGEILKGKAPGNFLRYGYSTSAAFHAYFIRVLYDFGLILGTVLTFLNLKKLSNLTGIRVAMSLTVLGLTTNMIYGSFFFVSTVILNSNAEFFKK